MNVFKFQAIVDQILPVEEIQLDKSVLKIKKFVCQISNIAHGEEFIVLELLNNKIDQFPIQIHQEYTFYVNIYSQKKGEYWNNYARVWKVSDQIWVETNL